MRPRVQIPVLKKKKKKNLYLVSYNFFLNTKIKVQWFTPVISWLEGGDWEDCGSRPA
jgi:hypothetical protein